MQARQVEMQRAQCVIAEIEIHEIRQVAEDVDVTELWDLVLLQVQLYEARQVAEEIIVVPEILKFRRIKLIMW